MNDYGSNDGLTGKLSEGAVEKGESVVRTARKPLRSRVGGLAVVRKSKIFGITRDAVSRTTLR
jgi:hypothetical protein